MTNKFLYSIIAVSILLGMAAVLTNMLTPKAEAPTINNDVTACTADAMLCPDGSYVGRSGPNCEFVCPELTVPADVQAMIDSKADLIKINSPAPVSEVSSPLALAGQARGYWFFEASAPVVLVNWDGLIIAEGFVTAEGEWMTEEFVPFSGELTFVSPYKAGDPDFMKRGAIIFQKDNPSGLPENDDALEIPIFFKP